MQGEDLQELLAQAIRKERQAYRRATYLTAIPVIIGVLVFSFFTYRVLKLRQESARLDEEISDKTQQLDALRASLEVARDESATNAVKAVKSETTLKQIASGVADPRKQARETLTAIARPTPTVKPSPGRPLPGPPSPSPKQLPPTGFIGTSYRGHDKTVITVEVTANVTRLSATYDLDGKSGIFSPGGAPFHFTLDKSKHDPSRLFMFFDFYSDKDGAYNVKITASDGSVLNLVVPQGNQVSRTRVFYFDII